MNCQDFENIVNDLAREQMIKAGVRMESLAHRDECDACARRLEDERALSFKLRALAAETRFAEVPALEDKLRTAFQQHQFAISRPAVAHHWRYWAAAAAIVLAVIAVAGMRSQPVTPSAQNPSSPSSPESTSPSGTAVTTTIANAPTILVDSRPTVWTHSNATLGRRTSRNKGRNTGRKTNPLVASPQSTPDPDSKSVAATETATTVATNSSAPEIATDFIPVGYQNAMNLQDGGQIVRVQLPRSALVAFGLPVNMDRYNEKVKADVFFGTDGMARAIRFVQ